MAILQPMWLREEEVPALPNGWKAMQTSEVTVQLKPGKLFEKKTVTETGLVPVLSQGESGFIGFHDEEPGIMASPDNLVVTFANHTCAMRLMKQPFSCIQNIFPKIGKKGICDTLFFYYAAQGRVILSDYKGHHPLFRQAYIPVAPLPTQRKIAAILSAYDDLIENNLRRIKILEEMAQNLYREWFVKFRFPGHQHTRFTDFPHGRIPERWEVVSVEQIVKRVPSGKKYDQKMVSATGTVPVLDQGKSGIIGYHDDEPGVLASEDAPIIVFANHTCYQRLVMFSFSAIQNVLPFVPSSEYQRNIYWLHYATKDLVTFNDYKGHWPEFMAKELILPSSNACQQFGGFVEPITRLIYKMETRNEALRRTRDLLLPRLISGDVDVSELDIAVPEEAER